MNFSRISNLEKSFSCFQGFQIWKSYFRVFKDFKFGKSFPWTTQSKHLIPSLDFRARYLWQLKCSVGFFFWLNHLSFLTSTQHGSSVVRRFIICESIFFLSQVYSHKIYQFFSVLHVPILFSMFIWNQKVVTLSQLVYSICFSLILNFCNSSYTCNDFC
jgi:hypothetical protein